MLNEFMVGYPQITPEIPCLYAQNILYLKIMKTLTCTLLMSLILSSNTIAQDTNNGTMKKEINKEVMTKYKDEYTVNTSTLCDARGFKGPTPLLVTFKKKNIVKVEALPNMETPRFFSRVVKDLLPKFVDIEADKADDVDCITGATMSSKAVIANIHASYKYYKENSKKKK